MNTDFGTRGRGFCKEKYLKMWKFPWNWVMCRGWKNFSKHDGKSIAYFELLVEIWILKLAFEG